jgi:hypothetical protein
MIRVVTCPILGVFGGNFLVFKRKIGVAGFEPATT